jgi:hypothetical protein
LDITMEEYLSTIIEEHLLQFGTLNDMGELMP